MVIKETLGAAFISAIKITTSIVLLITSILAGAYVSSLLYPVFSGEGLDLKAEIPDHFSLNYPSRWNYRQSLNNCGPYAIAGLIRAVSQVDKINSESVVNDIPYRVPDRLTLPWGLESIAKNNGFRVITPYADSFNRTEKALALQEKMVSNNSGAVILGGYRLSYYRHYIVVMGFQKNELGTEYFIYDPLVKVSYQDSNLTQDLNGDLPGNKTLDQKDLLDFWSRGGVGGIYSWYFLVISKQE